MRTSLDLLIEALSGILYIASGEWLFTLTRRPNGGDMVLVRSIWISVVVYLVMLYAKGAIHPEMTAPETLDQLRTEIVLKLHWFGAIFAGVYASLYARFASQWMYLSNLDNKIRETLIRNQGAAKFPAMAEWKAGFLEDAQLMHLATHRVFVPVIRKWGKEDEVEKKFLEDCPRGKRRFDKLIRDVEAAFQRQESKYRYKDSQRHDEKRPRNRQSSGTRRKSK